MKKRASILDSHLFSIILAAAATLTACFFVERAHIHNPAIILATVMVIFTAGVGKVAGGVSTACSVAYFLYFYSQHNFVHFNAENFQRCTVAIIGIIIMYIIVAVIREKRDEARDRLESANLRLSERVENQKEVLNVLRRESDYDALTDIYNRRGGDKKIIEIYNTRKADDILDGTKIVLATMDIDDFKAINDSYGHFVGDEALQHFAISLYNYFPENSVPIRAGGDEFNLFLYGRDVADIEKRLLDFVNQTFTFEHHGKTITFHASCGYATYPAQADSTKELYRKADEALYHVKMSGKHRAMRYNADIDGHSRAQMISLSRRISKNLPVAYMIYRADASEEILSVSDTLLEMCECADFKTFIAHTGGTFRGFVHPDDVDAVEKSIADQIKNNPYALDAVNYRIKTKSGKILNLHDLGRLVQDDDMDPMFYVIVYDEAVFNAANNADDVFKRGASGADVAAGEFAMADYAGE